LSRLRAHYFYGNEGPDPKDTIRILDEFVRRELINDATFKQMHHLGDSMAGFQKYCSTVSSFTPGGNNHQLHDKLHKLLEPTNARAKNV
jgi:hypothetical protein